MRLNSIRTMLSGKSKRWLSMKFPRLKLFFNRKLVFNAMGLKKYINKENNALLLGKGILPTSMFYKVKYSGWLNSEFTDIVCPLLPDKSNVTQYPYLEGPYEYGNVTIEKGDVVFDCGASMGLFSVMCANFNCTCYAFEPMPYYWEWLAEIARLNPNISIVPLAVSDNNGEVWFSNNDDMPFFSGMFEKNLNSIKVDTVTLDSFVENNGINRVNFIKADIEGAERLLLKGARKILKEFAPKLSICKYHMPDDPKVLRELILEANSNYIIEEKYMKIYAYVPK